MLYLNRNRMARGARHPQSCIAGVAVSARLLRFFCPTRKMVPLSLATILLGVSGLVLARPVEVTSVGMHHEADRYLLFAQIELELNPTIEAGLASGVPIYFNFDVRIDRIRKYWFDDNILKKRRRFALVYYELTRHFRVTVVDEDISKNFRLLFDALEYIGNIRSMSLNLEDLSQTNHAYRGSVEFALDIGALPLPLRPQAFVSSAWRMQSEERQWQIN